MMARMWLRCRIAGCRSPVARGAGDGASAVEGGLTEVTADGTSGSSVGDESGDEGRTGIGDGNAGIPPAGIGIGDECGVAARTAIGAGSLTGSASQTGGASRTGSGAAEGS